MVSMLGNIARSKGDDEEAQLAYAQALTTARQLEDVSLIARSLANLGNIARDRDDYELAMRYNREAMPLFEQLEDRFSLGLMYINISRMHVYASEHDEAKATLRQALAIASELEDRNMQRRSVFIGALLTADQQEWMRSILLLSASEKLRIESQIEQVSANAQEQAKAVQAILAHINVATFEELWERGRTLTWKEMNACINGEDKHSSFDSEQCDSGFLAQRASMGD